jgi:TonB family protein
MPITQIPFQDPAAPPEKSQPEQLGLYDVREWETAYGDDEAKVPHLLIQLQDDLERSRRREAAWISIIVHLLVFIVLWNSKLIGKYMPWHRAVVVAVDATKDKNFTVLALPPDAQKLTQKPKTNVLSDKDRIATTRHPQLDPKELRKILTPPPGAPGLPGRQSVQPGTPPPAVAQGPQQQQPQQGQPPPPRPQFDSNQTAKLQMPQPTNSFSKYAAPTSAGSAIEQATQAAAASRGGGGQGGDFGMRIGSRGGAAGSLEILSDTLGVDFSAYLARIHDEIERHWYEVLPPSVLPPLYKKGKLRIQFTIMKDGSVRGMVLAISSGDTALDRAAWGGIVGSSPLPPLPEEYIQRGGQDLTIQGTFLYNPDPRDLQ